MNDIYILHHDRSFLVSVLDGIRREAAALGLFISERKTHIMPLRQGFTFCKIRYSFTPSGRLLTRPVRETFTRERRRLKSCMALRYAVKSALQTIGNSITHGGQAGSASTAITLSSVWTKPTGGI